MHIKKNWKTMGLAQKTNDIFFKEKQTLIPLVWWLENFQEEGRPTPLAKSVKKNILLPRRGQTNAIGQVCQEKYFLVHKTIFFRGHVVLMPGCVCGRD